MSSLVIFCTNLSGWLFCYSETSFTPIYISTVEDCLRETTSLHLPDIIICTYSSLTRASGYLLISCYFVTLSQVGTRIGEKYMISILDENEFQSM